MRRIIFYIFLTFVYILSSYAAPGNKNNHALVIIDMQPYFVTRGGNHKQKANAKKVEEVLDTLTQMIKGAKKSGIPIVFLEYQSCGDTNKALKKVVGDYKDVRYILKDQDGMFSQNNSHKKKLESYLEKMDVGTLIIAGANGGACVSESIEGALDENYSVIAFSKGIADFNYKEFIYPYDDQYSFKPTCNNCSFREFDKLSEYTLEIADGNIISGKTEVNDSSRGRIKERAPSPSKIDEHARPASTVFDQ